MTKTRRVKRGGGKGKLYSPKNKTIKSGIHKTHKPKTHKIKTARKSALKTLKMPVKKPEVTPDKYAEGIIKFLNKIIDVNVDSKSYDLYVNIANNMKDEITEEMKKLGIHIKEYDFDDWEYFIEDLRDILEKLIDKYKNADANDKLNAEIQLYTVLNPIMDSIKKTKKDFKSNKKNNVNALANIFMSGLIIKKIEQPKKKNLNVSDLASLFSGVTI